RLVPRTRQVRATDRSLIVARRLAPAGSSLGVDTRLTWSPARVAEGPEAGWVLDCRIEVAAVGPWEGTWPRVGLHLVLPAASHQAAGSAEWFGLGPAEAWPDLQVATWLGRHRSALADLQHPRVRPQITGQRGDLRELTVKMPDSGAVMMRPLAGPMGFTISPHAPHEQNVAHRD